MVMITMADEGDNDDGDDDGDGDQYLPVGRAQSRYLSSGWETFSDLPPTKCHFQFRIFQFCIFLPFSLTL